MATNQFVTKHGLISKDDVQVTGSVTASNGFYGTASNATTAAFCNNANFANVASVANLANTASFALNAGGISISGSWASSSLSSSFALSSHNADTASSALQANTASWANNLAPFDQYFNSVSVLLHFDGTNGQTTTYDSSQNNFPVSMSNMVLASANPKFGPTSLSQSAIGSIVGNQSLLQVVSSSKFEALANEDITVEGWYRFDYVDADALLWTTIAASGSAGGTNVGQVAYLASGSGGGATTTGSVIWQLNSPGFIVQTPEILYIGPQWYHIAFVRSGSGVLNCRIYINGNLQASASYTGSFTSTGPLCISNFSQSNNFGYSVYGSVDEFRWTKTFARYSANFTTASVPFPSAGTYSASFAIASHIADSASFSTFTTSASFAVSASNAISSAWAPTGVAASASFSNNAISSSFALVSHLADSASYSTNNLSSSFSLASISASFSLQTTSASFALASHNADSASWSTNNLSSSFSLNSHLSDSGSYSTSASAAITSSFSTHTALADTSSYSLSTPLASGDPFFSNVSVLLHFDGNNNDTTSIDSGPNNFPVSMSNFSLSSNNPKFGTTCLTGSTNITRLTVASSSAFEADISQSLTIEGWYRFSAYNSDSVLFTNITGSGANEGTVAYGVSDGTIFWQLGAAGGRSLQTPALIVTSSTNWYHLAFVRNGTGQNNCGIYVNGVLQASLTDNGAIRSTSPLVIGVFIGSTNGGYDIAGGVDEFRWTKGIARYTSNFGTSSAPFPSAGFNITASTMLLTGSNSSFPLIVRSNVNNESEIINSNLNGGATASTDVVCFNDLGSAASYQSVYDVDLGINSSGYAYPFIGTANDAYLFNTGSQSSSFYIGCIDTTGSVRIFAGNYLNTGSGFNIYSQSITSSIPILGTASYATTGQTASYIASTNIDKVFYYHESYDFLQATTASGQIDGCWSYNTGTLKTGAPEFNHPGILWLSASQILNQINTFTNFGPSNVPSASVQLGNVTNTTFILSLSTGSYQYAVRFGFFDDITTETPANGIYFEKTGSPLGTFNTASQQLNNWIGVVRTGSVSRTITSSISSTASLAWHRFTIATSGNPALGTTASFYIDGTLAGVITSSLTGSLPVIYGLQHNEKATIATTGSAFATKIDYIEILGSCVR